MNNILLRIRFPHYAEEIRSKYDERCAQIFELFCIYGKISQEQVLNQLAQISDFPMVYGEDLETFDPHDSSKKSFAQLVKVILFSFSFFFYIYLLVLLIIIIIYYYYYYLNYYLNYYLMLIIKTIILIRVHHLLKEII